MMERWLVRTEKNVISGPYPRELVQQMIRDGKLALEDEVCCANSYWFFLHEQDEVQKLLGVRAPKLDSMDNEITETETQTDTQTRSVQAQTQAKEHSLNEPLIPDIGEVPEDTKILSNRALREFHTTPAHGPAPHAGSGATTVAAPINSVSIKPAPAKPALVKSASGSPASQQLYRRAVLSVERPSFWRGFAGVLALLIMGAVVYAFMILRQNGRV